MEEKTIIIKEENGQTSFETKGFTDMEIIGLLSYYKDLILIESIKKNVKVESE